MGKGASLMKVNLQQLQVGNVLLEDVYSMSPNPIMLKNTTLNSKLLEILRIFSINQVDVSDYLDSGELFTPKRVQEEEKKAAKQASSPFSTPYEEAIARFKEQFISWQNGSPINIFGVQGILLTLINAYLTKPYKLFRFHEYTKEEDYIFHHSVSVGVMSAYLAQKMKYPKRVCNEIGLAGMLVDCGMAKIPPHYLYKTKDLDHDSVQQLSKHPIYSYQMLKNISSLSDGVMLAVLQHHEREDGTGYPLGVLGSQLHHYAKIVMIMDAYHAMVSHRHYRKPISPFTALEILNKDLVKFDPRALLVLTQEVPQLFVGNQVTLSNKEIGEIIFIPNDSPTRPMIRLQNGQALALSQYPSLLIDKIH